MTQDEINELQERKLRGETTEEEEIALYMEAGMSRMDATVLVNIERGGSDLQPIDPANDGQ